MTALESSHRRTYVILIPVLLFHSFSTFLSSHSSSLGVCDLSSLSAFWLMLPAQIFGFSGSSSIPFPSLCLLLCLSSCIYTAPGSLRAHSTWQKWKKKKPHSFKWSLRLQRTFEWKPLSSESIGESFCWSLLLPSVRPRNWLLMSCVLLKEATQCCIMGRTHTTRYVTCCHGDLFAEREE